MNNWKSRWIMGGVAFVVVLLILVLGVAHS